MRPRGIATRSACTGIASFIRVQLRRVALSSPQSDQYPARGHDLGGTVSKLFAVVVLMFLCTLSSAQATPACTVSEDSIFREARICGKSHEGSLRKSDLTVAGFDIGGSTLEDVAKRFPGSHHFRLSKAMEAGTGICVQNQRGEAVVFSLVTWPSRKFWIRSSWRGLRRLKSKAQNV